MSKVKASIGCPGCTTQNHITFKQPTRFEPTVVKFICIKCDSGVMARVAIPKGERKPGACEIQTRLTSVGDEMHRIWRERLEKERAEEAKKQSTEDGESNEQVLGMDHQPAISPETTADPDPGATLTESAAGTAVANP